MSGIVGIVNRGEQPVSRGLLEEMTGALSFRGPDAQEIWVDRHVGFGHTLLQVSDDTSIDRQPLSIDGRVWITADARIDDRPNLIRKLTDAGAAVSASSTDAELMLQAYLIWGDGCTDHLFGDFVAALWDGRTQRLWCIRDQIGVKPFFYTETASGFLFSNTLACLRRHPAVSSGLNDQAIGDFLLFGYNAEPDTTAFTAIRRLPPAHTLQWDSSGLRLQRYWRVPVREPLRYRRPDDYVDQFSELLRHAVADRTRTTRVAVSMSGGLDSSSVAATAHEVLSRRGDRFDLHAWTVILSESAPDEEGRYASLVAGALGIPITCHAADRYNLFERREHPSVYGAEPKSLAAAARHIERLQQVAEQSRVMLTGQGGDVILRPSPSYLIDMARKLEFGRFAADAWTHMRRYGRVPRLGLRTRLRQRAERQDAGEPFPDWIDAEFAKRQNLHARWSEVHARRPSPTAHHRPESLEKIGASRWSQLFEAFDPGRTYALVEFRHPLFDLRLIDFALRVPSMPWCVDKALLREVMRGKLPEQVRCRRKTPLGRHPSGEFLKSANADWLARLPDAPVLARYIRRGWSSVGAVPATLRDFRPLYLNFWLHSLLIPVNPVKPLQEEREDAFVTRA